MAITTTDEATNVLIVDDLPEKLLVYRTILEELRLNLITASSGEEALRAVLNHDFAVILLDVQMPGINGFETAALIRKRKRSAHVPIIFLTAFADEVRAAEGYAQGAVDYITTPVIPAVLLAKVRVFADLYRMTQQVRRQAEERVALVEERSKREAAEEANRWLDFLTRAGAALNQSLDPRVARQSVVRLPVPLLADEAVLAMPPPQPGLPVTYVRGRRAGDEAQVDEDVAPAALDPAVLGALDRSRRGGSAQLGLGMVVAVPFLVRGHAYGVLALSRAPSGRPFSSAAVTVAEMYAARAASALENSRLYNEVQEADRQKNEFLSMLAHELRNPLAPIRNANEVLRQKAAEPAKVRWAQGVIDRQLTHLVRLVDDLLDVSRLTLGKIRLEPERVALEKVITQAIEATQPLIDQFGHTVEVVPAAGPIRVMGDEARLTQVFVNLLNNAAKYTEPGGRVRVSSAVEGATAVVRVRDTGVGIPADLLPRVFDLFTQANRSLDRSQGGLGIGLTLVRQLVEMQGGTVEAHSEGPGRGSEFVIRLPVLGESLSNERRLPRSECPRGGNGCLKVVAVDDNADAADSLAELLGMLGHEVAVAADGPSALAVIAERQPDVVMLDIGLPGMTGYEVARRVKSSSNPAPVLIAVSGYGRDEDRQSSRAAGFDHHLVKPIQLDVLRAVLEGIASN